MPSGESLSKKACLKSVMYEFPLQLQKDLADVWNTMKDEQGIGYQDFYDEVKEQA